MFWRTTLIALTLLFVSILPAAAGEAYDALRRATNALRLGDYALTRTELENSHAAMEWPDAVKPVTRTWPEGFLPSEIEKLDLTLEIARYFILFNAHLEAQQFYDQVLTVLPSNPEALAGRAETALARGEYIEAGVYARRLIEAAPDDPHGYELSAVIAAGQRNPDEALMQYEAAWLQNPASVAPLIAAAQLLWGDDNEQALLWIDRALLAAPNDAKTHALRGFILEHLARHPEAEDEFRRAAELAKAHDPDVLAARAYLRNMQGDFAGAAQVAEAALAIDPEHLRAQIEASFAHAALGQWDRTGYTATPDQGRPYYGLEINLSAWIMRVRDHDRSPESGRIYRSDGACCGEGEFFYTPDEAGLAEVTEDIARYEESEEGEGSGDYHLHRAELYERMREWDLAYDDFRKAFHGRWHDNDHVVTRLWQYRVLFGEQAVLRKDFVRLREENPQGISDHTLRDVFTILVAANDWSGLEAEAKALLTLFPEQTFSVIALAFARRTQGHPDEAGRILGDLAAKLDARLAIIPADAGDARDKVLSARSRVAAELGDYALAVRLFEEFDVSSGALIDLHKSQLTYGLNHLAEVTPPYTIDDLPYLIQAGRTWNALVLTQEWLTRDPQNPDALVARGQVYAEADLEVLELNAFYDALELAPEHVEAWLGIARNYKRNWDDELFDPILEKLRILAPDDARVRMLHVDQVFSSDPEAALADCEVVLAQDPTHRPALVEKGLLLVELGRFTEALAVAEELDRLDPEYARGFELRMEALLWSGDWVGARRLLEQKLDANPNDVPIYMIAG